MILRIVKEAFQIPDMFYVTIEPFGTNVKYRDLQVGSANLYIKEHVGPGPDFDKTKHLMLDISYRQDLVNIPVEEMDIKPRISVDNQAKEIKVSEIRLDRKPAKVYSLNNWNCICDSRDLFAFGCRCKPKS